MSEYSESELEPIADAFTIKNGNGKEFIYRVNLDGYLHGVVLEKSDKAKYEASIRSKTKGGNHGKSSSDIKRRIRNERSIMGRTRDGDGRDLKSRSDSRHGGLGSGSPRSNNAGSDSGRESFDRTVSDSDKLNSRQNQDRPTSPITNRTLLANALESTTQDETELTRLREYRMSIDYLNEQEAKLTELRSQIREISFGKGPRDTARLKQLQEEANKTAT